MAALRKQYLLEGLCCGNCAAKIEKDAGLLEVVKKATVDADADKLSQEITRIAVSHDADIVVKESWS